MTSLAFLFADPPDARPCIEALRDVLGGPTTSRELERSIVRAFARARRLAEHADTEEKLLLVAERLGEEIGPAETRAHVLAVATNLLGASEDADAGVLEVLTRGFASD